MRWLHPGRGVQVAAEAGASARGGVEGATTRAGFVALVGRPNVGKSTLVNRLVETKVGIVSDKPQTTRRELRGVVTGDGWQMVLCDLPGFQRPRDILTERMQARVERSLADSDVVLFIVSAAEPIGAGDRFIAEAVRAAQKPTVAAVNKIDAVDRETTALALLEVEKLGLPGEIFPVSAKTGENVAALRDHLVTLLPEGPFLYPPEVRSDLPPELAFAELVREQVLLRTREEVPHAVEVEVSEIEQRDDGSLVVHADIWCETESQKGILIGRGGRMIKAIGSAARREMSLLAGTTVHLDLRVRVRKRWRKDESLVERLGIG
ncbi:GTPase Era [Thermoleophilum album]|nr:GTPase Era [Thermoleophilum album]